jgi:hypothetical protein
MTILLVVIGLIAAWGFAAWTYTLGYAAGVDYCIARLRSEGL